ncbi:putative amino-acid metabolite efflux pump [Roseovarius albus]|uniref:Putative amino-acid metabolite efflux pump n=1 Tax=Roseovarius albus TaxID=1247867 RepID=A0A1X6YRB0_9RHOB|nr:EamA family transporter [Roseovarius albus]SLN28982.1 putative amino-acid metabolite efflux pump [Roseovarius albus]
MTTVPKIGVRDALLGVCVALTWGMGIVFAKAAITHFPPILLMSIRFAITALALVWWVKPPVGQLKMLGLIAFISAAMQYSFTYTGLKGLDASAAALIVQLEVPFLTLCGMVALKEKTSLRKWLGIGIAFFGVWKISGTPHIAAAWISVLMVIGGAAVWAVGQVMIRQLHDIDGLTVIAWVAVWAAPQLLVMSLTFETGHVEAITSATWVVWGAAFYMGLVMTALGYGIWYTLIRRNPVGQVAPFLLLLPLFSVAGAVIFLGESLSLQVMIGGAIVLAGVAIIMFDKNA